MEPFVTDSGSIDWYATGGNNNGLTINIGTDMTDAWPRNHPAVIHIAISEDFYPGDLTTDSIISVVLFDDGGTGEYMTRNLLYVSSRNGDVAYRSLSSDMSVVTNASIGRVSITSYGYIFASGVEYGVLMPTKI